MDYRRITLWGFVRYTHMYTVEDSNEKDFIDSINRARAGDKEAFGQIYTQYFTPVYRYVYFRMGASLGDTAQDITQVCI